MSMISGTAGCTTFCLKKYCWETTRFSRCAWPVSDLARLKTAGDRRDLQSFSKAARTPITRAIRKPVNGLAILWLSRSLPMKSTDDYAGARDSDTDKARR